MNQPAVDRRSASRDREQVRRAAHLLDEAFRIPGTNRRFGVEPLVGLVPVLGDGAGLALTGALILQAIRLGARGSTVVRMLLYAALDAAIGTIPVVGSVFDFVFKANTRIIGLLERHTMDPAATQTASRAVVIRTLIGAVLGLIVISIVLVALVVWVIAAVT